MNQGSNNTQEVPEPGTALSFGLLALSSLFSLNKRTV
ncbi:PEP-CTERM sorting domain-containing protein [Stanieria cyanosphaera]